MRLAVDQKKYHMAVLKAKEEITNGLIFTYAIN